MPQIQPTHRKSLNPKQLQILYLLYKFRFGTTDLFVKSYGSKISRQYIDVRLRILCEQEYIGRKYDSTYKLQGRPASYCLLPKGVKLLKQQPDRFNPAVLRNVARDKREDVSDQFIRHSLSIFSIYNQCRRLYGDDLLFITKSNLYGRDTFPQPLPDAYLSLKDDKTKHLFLESFEETIPLFVIKKRIRYYADYAEDNDLPPTRSFPGILFICDTAKLKQQVLLYATKRFGRSWKDIKFNVYTRAELSTATNLFSFRK